MVRLVFMLWPNREERSLPVRMETPIMSRLFHRAPLRAAMSLARGSCFGMTKMQSVAMGMHTSATNQNTHDHDVYWTKIAPITRPRTFPTAPQPPKIPMARDCSVGSGNTLTSNVNAEGIVKLPPVSHVQSYVSRRNVQLTYTTQCTKDDDHNFRVHESCSDGE